MDTIALHTPSALQLRVLTAVALAIFEARPFQRQVKVRNATRMENAPQRAIHTNVNAHNVLQYGMCAHRTLRGRVLSTRPPIHRRPFRWRTGRLLVCAYRSWDAPPSSLLPPWRNPITTQRNRQRDSYGASLALHCRRHPRWAALARRGYSTVLRRCLLRTEYKEGHSLTSRMGARRVLPYSWRHSRFPHVCTEIYGPHSRPLLKPPG